jgi:hypothetical protein
MRARTAPEAFLQTDADIWGYRSDKETHPAAGGGEYVFLFHSPLIGCGQRV